MTDLHSSESEAPASGDIRLLVTALVDFARPRLPVTLFTVSLAAVLEGAGIVLLLPVAETIFSQSQGAVQTGLTARLTAHLAEFGIETVLQQLAFFGLGFLLLVSLRAYVLMRRDVLLLELSRGFVDHERRKFFGMLAESEWPVIKRYRKADLLNSMTVNIGRLANAMHFIANGLVTSTIGLACLAAAFVVSWTLGGLLLAMTAAGLVLALLWSRRSRRSGQKLNRANRRVMDETTRFLDGLKAAKAARAEIELTNRFAESVAETRAINIAFVQQQARLRNAIQLPAAVVALMVLLVGFGVLGLSGGELLVMAAIILRLAPSLHSTLSGMQGIAHALPAFSAIRQLENEIASEHAALAIPRLETSAQPPREWPAAPLQLDNVRVQVRNERGEKVNLVTAEHIHIAPGTLVHIGGPSGAGKSSLAELVAGLHLPASGTVGCGELFLTAETRRDWQARVAFAPQEPFLFDGTVRENLLWPNRQCEDAEIWQALDDAQASSIVRGLPLGLEEELLDGGARLSGGERQRLCLARTLLSPASLLILDEATSAMDPELERTIVATLKKHAAERIVLMVSHSRNALDLADMRIDVAEGVARVTAKP